MFAENKTKWKKMLQKLAYHEHKYTSDCYFYIVHRIAVICGPSLSELYMEIVQHIFTDTIYIYIYIANRHVTLCMYWSFFLADV